MMMIEKDFNGESDSKKLFSTTDTLVKVHGEDAGMKSSHTLASSFYAMIQGYARAAHYHAFNTLTFHKKTIYSSPVP